jgi:hypothetical protein
MQARVADPLWQQRQQPRVIALRRLRETHRDPETGVAEWALSVAVAVSMHVKHGMQTRRAEGVRVRLALEVFELRKVLDYVWRSQTNGVSEAEAGRMG